MADVKTHSGSVISIAVASALLTSGCGESSSYTAGEGYGTGGNAPVTTSFNEQALLTHLTDNVITPVFQQFNADALQQAQEVSAYCESEVALANFDITDAELTPFKSAARLSWENAMESWQQAEMMQMGPLLDNDGLLKNNIYSWPVVNYCAVDYDVEFFREGEVNGAPYDITLRTPSRKGMVALEYLLFNEDLDVSCESGSPGNWHNLSNSERRVARCEFAVEVANDIATSSETLLSLWAGDNGYAAQLKSAGSASSMFASEHEAVNRISDAMFYLDSMTKDGKLATPLGLFANSCGAQACPEDVESGYAQRSFAHILNNLIGFQALLTGSDGPGFTDFLIDVGDTDTAETMRDDITTAIENVRAYETTLAEALVQDPDAVTQTHADVKSVTDNLKADFINSLALELPATSAGDND
ncbi:imelysin family protein [Alteromonas confluentis]|uniref:Imelysin-like domain-containing protein n=1 Tax=Alteromonas confluentis TaxID=1656094 RepID=A0A1E7Z7A9_9ALTE|nr:imelysin family protein [Alteromonas confluentis]OFC69415.1 hypothetical protein BFC18_18580 [Alteromonas confluentis]